MNNIPINSHHCTTTHSACGCVLERLKKLENLADQVESMLSTATRWINVYHEPYWTIDDKLFQAVNKAFEELK